MSVNQCQSAINDNDGGGDGDGDGEDDDLVGVSARSVGLVCECVWRREKMESARESRGESRILMSGAGGHSVSYSIIFNPRRIVCGSWFFYVVSSVQERVETNFLEKEEGKKRRRENEKRRFWLCLLGSIFVVQERVGSAKYTRISTFQVPIF